MRKKLGVSRTRLCVLAGFALLLLQLPTRVVGQVVGATLSGTVSDQSGAVVPNVKVEIRDNATGEVRTVTTNGNGVYSGPNLQPDSYTVTFTAAGFSKVVHPSVVLTVGGGQVLNLTMQVGQSAQTVEVTAEAPTVNLANAEIGSVTTEKTIVDLPLNGRSWSDLASLQSGVYQLHTQPALTTRDRFTRGYGIQLSISGARPQQNNYRVDGISINDPGNGGPGNVLGANAGVDAISEFSVLTTNYSTEYGRASGGIINATTKSGTNQFHGSAYEFLRNSWLDAPNYFDITEPQFRRNQFGASGGGPIAKNKSFIFGDYEGLRQSLGLSESSPVPSVAAAATADPRVAPYLAAFFPIGGKLKGKSVCSIVPNAGNDTDLCVFGASQVSTENYYIIRTDHNISEKDRLSGTFFRDHAMLGTPDEYNNKVVDTATSSMLATVSETHTFSSNLVNSARFGYHRDFQGGPAGATAINPATQDATFGVIPGYDAPQVAIANGNTNIFTGGLTSYNPQTNHWNTFQVYDDAFFVKGKHSLKFGGSVERDQLNILTSQRPGGTFAFGSVAAFLANSSATIITDLPGTITPKHPRTSIFGLYIQDDWHIRPNLTINLGLRYEPATVPHDAEGQNSTLPSLFDTTGTELPICGKAIPGICNPQPDGLFRNNTKKDFDPRVGFAWDPQGNGKTAVRGGFGFYDQLPLIAYMGSTSNGKAWPYLFSAAGTLVPGSFQEIPSSFSLSSCPAATNGVYPNGTPAYCQIARSNGIAAPFIDRNPKRAYVEQWNLSIQREIFPNLTAFIGYVGSHGVHGTTQTDDVNEVFPKNIGGKWYWPCDNIQPNLGVRNIFSGSNIGDCPSVNASPTNPPYPTLNQSFGKISGTFFRNSSVYHGLELQLTKALSHGLQVQGAFTFQKSIDTPSGAVISDSVVTAISSLNWFDAKLTRAVSDFNVSKVFTLNYLWSIPTPTSGARFLHAAFGGWQLGGIISASSGEPFTPLMTNSNNGNDALGQNSSDPFSYPNRVPGCGNSLTNAGNINNYVKLQCFSIPTVTNIGGVNYIPLGNAGRNILVGPGLENFDFSLIKNTNVKRISETFDIQIRWEVFNLTNRVNFNPPVANEVLFDVANLAPGNPGGVPGPKGPCLANDPTTGCNAAAGAISGSDHTATTSRQMQLSVKFIW